MHESIAVTAEMLEAGAAILVEAGLPRSAAEALAKATYERMEVVNLELRARPFLAFEALSEP